MEKRIKELLAMLCLKEDTSIVFRMEGCLLAASKNRLFTLKKLLTSKNLFSLLNEKFLMFFGPNVVC